MQSPHTSPALRPASPLSPHYDVQAHFDPLQPQAPRALHGRHGHGQRPRRGNTSLKLPSLPRFHPANFPSAQSSVGGTPGSALGSPQPPISPRSHQRMFNDAQKQLYLYQRDSIAVARGQTPVALDKPVSPKLAPMGSPGPVTPLQLEQDESYLIAGARMTAGDFSDSSRLVDRLIEDEARRRRDAQLAQNARGDNG